MKINFLHTSDWHIGFAGKKLGHDISQKILQIRLESLEKLIKTAKTKNIDFLLVAGDTFEDHSINSKLVGNMADILDTLDVMVYFLPGNHDPNEPGSLWKHSSLKNKKFQLLTSIAPIQISENVIFYPCPVDLNKSSLISPVEHLLNYNIENDPFKNEKFIRIGISHGNCLSGFSNQPDWPIFEEAAVKAKLDYLALGHWHGQKIIKQQKNYGTTAYSGTHEISGFEEKNSGKAFLVTIDEPLAQPNLEVIDNSILSWEKKDKNFISDGDLKIFFNDIKTITEPEQTLLKITFKGLLCKENLESLEQIQEFLNRNFLWNDIDKKELKIQLSEDWQKNMPKGPAHETYLELLKRSENDPNQRQALLEFLALWPEEENL